MTEASHLLVPAAPRAHGRTDASHTAGTVLAVPGYTDVRGSLIWVSAFQKSMGGGAMEDCEEVRGAGGMRLTKGWWDVQAGGVWGPWHCLGCQNQCGTIYSEF